MVDIIKQAVYHKIVLPGLNYARGEKMTVYGYVRVSTDKQDGEGQLQGIREYCREKNLPDPVIIQETASGIKARPKLEALINELGPGDTLVVFELSRLSRQSISAVYAMVDRIRKTGAKLIESRSDFVANGSLESDLRVFGLSIAARIERDLISQRTKAGLKARKAKGLPLGRPAGKSKLDNKRKEIARYLEKGVSKTDIAKLLDCSRSTLLNFIKHMDDLPRTFTTARQRVKELRQGAGAFYFPNLPERKRLKSREPSRKGGK